MHLNEFTEIECLMMFEGLTFSHCEREDKDYIVKWVDYIDGFSCYVAIEVTEADVQAYTRCEITCAALERKSPQLFYGPYHDMQPIKYEDMDDGDIAPEGSFYDPDLAPPVAH